MKNKFLLLVVTVLLAATPLLAVNGPVEANAGQSTDNTIKDGPYCGVHYDQIVQYMWVNAGVSIVQVQPITGQCDVVAYSADAKRFVVFISEGVITGYEDYQL